MRMKHSILLLASFLWVRCGVKEPKTELPKDLNKLTTPDYSLKHTGLNLEAFGPKGLGLNGALTFWKKQEDGNIEPFKKVIRYSGQMKETMGAIARAHYEEEALELGLNQLKEKVAKSFGNHVKFFFDSLLKKRIKEDHEKEFAELGISEKDFSLYCDSQYVDFCRSKLLLEESYTERPTPHALCESYYEKQGYFTANACRSDEAGKNYFSCFWSTDFLEKSNFKLMRKESRKLVEVPSSEIHSDNFQEEWHSEDWKSLFMTTENYIKKSILKREKGEKLYFYFDHLKKKMGDHLTLPLSEGLRKVYARDKGLKGGEKYSFSDLIFNSPLLANEDKQHYTYAIREADEVDLARLSSDHPYSFGAHYKKFDKESNEEAKELEKMEKEVKKRKEEIRLQKIKLDEDLTAQKALFDKLFVGKDENGKEKDLAYSMWPGMKITLETQEAGKMKLTWRLHDNIITPIGGGDTIDPPSFSCLVKKPGMEKDDLRNPNGLTNCTFDRNTGKLKFSLGRKVFEKMGWVLQPKTGNGTLPFNFIEKDQLKGASLSFNLDYIKYGDVMPMFTGEAILSTKEKEYWGTVLVKSF